MKTRTALLAISVGSAICAQHAAATEPTVITNCEDITASGSYVLGRNLSTSGDCLVVTTDFVTIDLAGFVMAGDGTGTGVLARLDGPAVRGIAVGHGTVQGFNAGIEVVGSAIIEELRVIGNDGTGITVGNGTLVRDGIGSGSTVRHNIVENNRDNGIVVDGGALVSDNIVLRNDLNGIEAGVGSTIIHNVVFGGHDIGIEAVCPSIIVENTATSNTVDLVAEGEGCLNANNVAPIVGG